MPGSKPEDKKYVFTDHRGNVVENKETLEKIKKFAIPPAYKKVKIDLSACAKIIYEGYDDKNRLQQKYSDAHNKRAKKEKFCRLIDFGRAEPQLKADIKKYISSSRVTQNKIISLILAIIWKCGFRIGNRRFLKLYNSHGIGNIYKKHISFVNDGLKIEFVGKKSVVNKCCIRDKELIKELKDLIANKKDTDHVFTYKKEGIEVLIKATEINDFLKRYGHITSKDLRTFDANILMIEFLKANKKEYLDATSIAKRKKVVKKALEFSSQHLNNTAGICKSSYVLDELFRLSVEDPKNYKKHFMSETQNRILFINFLDKVYCKDILLTPQKKNQRKNK